MTHARSSVSSRTRCLPIPTSTSWTSTTRPGQSARDGFQSSAGAPTVQRCWQLGRRRGPRDSGGWIRVGARRSTHRIPDGRRPHRARSKLTGVRQRRKIDRGRGQGDRAEDSAVAGGDEMGVVAESAADLRAREVEQQMTDDERFSLIVSLMGAVPSIGVPRDRRIPEGVNMSAGYTPGVPRLGIPDLRSSDASMGVTNPGYRPDDEGATAFPASIVVGSSFNPKLARDGGAAIAREARIRGFNVMLAGGINLARDVRNGRNFEYYSEDPWLTAVLGAEAVNGIQGEGVISTIKHYTLNCNETNRHWLDAIVDPAAHRESDLLAFQIAIERSQPGSIMSGYNKINGEYASGNPHLLNEVLKGAWGYKGYVMSDWGAVPEWGYALNGLDQESGLQMDVRQWGSEAFTDRLRAAYAEGKLPKERLSDMVRASCDRRTRSASTGGGLLRRWTW